MYVERNRVAIGVILILIGAMGFIFISGLEGTWEEENIGGVHISHYIPHPLRDVLTPPTALAFVVGLFLVYTGIERD